MKANEAEKLYFNQHTAQYNHERRNDDDIEYTRTDIFIEKAVQWLKEQNEMIGVSFQEDFLERFKNYMKGE